MCGITLFIGSDQTEDISKKRKHFLELSKKIRHRGPDWNGIYIDNDNKTLRIRAIADGPDDGDHIDHVQISVVDSLTVGKSYKFVVTVESISGRFRIRPASNDPVGQELLDQTVRECSSSRMRDIDEQ